MSAEPGPRMDDEKLERVIGNLLRVGVTAAMLVVAIGGGRYLHESGNKPADHVVFVGEPHALKNIGDIVHLAWQGEGTGLIQLGVLVLIATPIARVVFSIYGFWLERDRLYIGFTLIVLALLIVGLIV